MDWQPVSDIPTMRNLSLRRYHERRSQGQDGVPFGPFYAAQWTNGTGEKPGPYDGIVAIHPETGEYVAVWGTGFMAKSSQLTGRDDCWHHMTAWDAIHDNALPYAADLEDDLADGIYVCLLPPDLDPRPWDRAPAFLLQKDGIQELWQSFYGPRRFRRQI